MSLSDTYIQYGVSSEVARELESKKIPLTTFRTTSMANLIKNYGLDSSIIDFVNDCIKRKPIASEIIQDLLEKSNFCCCVCKGQKSDAYIIHHIVEYHKTQDNSYENLAVLCPNDHDLAHRNGISLTSKLTEQQIRLAKANWEEFVKEQNKLRAKQGVTEFDRLDKNKIDFRIEEIYDSKAKNVECNYHITSHTKLVLSVTQSNPEQEFIVYLSIVTDEGDQKWIGFGTPLALKNVYSSERVYRIAKPGSINYTTVEYIIERVNESGLKFNGVPVLVNTIRFWGWHYNTEKIEFQYAMID